MTLSNLGNGRKGRRRRGGGILSMLSSKGRKGKRSPMDKLGGRSKKGKSTLADQFDGRKKRGYSRAGNIIANFVGAFATGNITNPVERIQSDYDRRDERYDQRRYGRISGHDAAGNPIRSWQNLPWWQVAWERFLYQDEAPEELKQELERQDIITQLQQGNMPLANPAPMQGLLADITQFFRDRGWIK
jgi:hypothetical protein